MSNPSIARGTYVSIHAPARGRTDGNPLMEWMISFQSTPPRGGELASPYLAR